MRVTCSKTNSLLLVTQAIQKIGSLKKLSETLGYSTRTLKDWSKGLFSIPEPAFNKLTALSGKKISSFAPTYLNDFWHIQNAGRMGGFARLKKYGNFGTPEGRRKGGLQSIRTHNKLRTGFKQLKRVATPTKTEALAELLGVMFGDGHLAQYQASVTTNSKTDFEHALFIVQQFQKIFSLTARLRTHKVKNYLTITVSSRRLVILLSKLGMPIGNKIEHHLTIPPWINQTKRFQRAFIRGLFDTDGCVYADKHTINNKCYIHMGWTITSYADTLIAGIVKLLGELGYSPTHRNSQRSVFLRKQKEVIKYFNEVGSHNPKHLARFTAFHGRVPKWS